MLVLVSFLSSVHHDTRVGTSCTFRLIFVSSMNIQKIFYLQTDMNPLQTSKNFGMYGSHIEGDIEPANEKCNFPKDTKLKTTCKFVSIL